MTASDRLLELVHLTAALGVALALAAAGRRAARVARQPEVIGEIVAGLLVGPALVRLLGEKTFGTLLPGDVRDALRLVAEAGLVLFMVGLAHELRLGSARPSARTTGWVIAGSFLPTMALGALLAGWLVADDPEVRGDAPLPAFVLTLAVCLSITAVPVLARILTDRAMTDTEPGRTALTSAIVIDAIAWLALAVAVGLRTGRLGTFLGSLAALAAGLVVTYLLRLLLSGHRIEALCGRHPGATALLIGATAIALALALEEAGMTAVFGAVLAGLAVPARRDSPWSHAVTSVTRIGRSLLPVFFVVSGLTVLTQGLGSTPFVLIALITLLGTVGKVLGGYAGARLGGQGHGVGLRVGALMNTRGLTEIIVLQIAYDARILTTPIYVAFLVMALITTVMTSPLLRLVDLVEKTTPRQHTEPLAQPAQASAETLPSGTRAVPPHHRSS
ncbi:integral membrane ion exchanger [Streptomyces mirabilis]|uniref:cation:proton antiporter n=1 Tax=Streptomyces mirabilis TaxID=68239 RepID=UPI00167D5A53|nr:cation:proton antiporter [Streptomyces mirabilis]GHD78014.1 integral membrane ion exchanger [Streptomyces mirabilis]